jgi:hypothetical protein
MGMPSVRLSATTLLAALALAAFLSSSAKSQIQATPSYVPIGVASSGGNTTTAWFHEPFSRQAMACQTVSSASTGLTSIQCVSTKLP